MPLLVKENFLLAFDYHPPASSSTQESILFIHSSCTEQSSIALSRLTALYPDNRFSLVKKEGLRFPESNVHRLQTLTYRESHLSSNFHLPDDQVFGQIFFCINMEIDVIANKQKPEGSFEEVEFEAIENKLRERYGNILEFLENTSLKENSYVIDKNFQVWKLTHRDIEACSGRWNINGDSLYLPSTALTLKEGEELFELGRFGPSDGAIVNIGNFLGGSSILLSKGSKKENREKVYSYDPKTYPLKKNYLQENQVEDWIIFKQTTSENGNQEWRKRKDRKIRLLFIDGDHSYEGCYKDITLWSPYLVPGGVIAIHDYSFYNSHGKFHEVVKAVYDTVLCEGEYCDFRREDYLFLANKV
jgi:hypothetical protein